MRKLAFFGPITILLLCAEGCARDPLPSWNEGTARQSILQFVKQATDPAGPNFVAPPDRVATFDNDGTLWAEQPLYVNVLFAGDQMKASAASHAEWSATPAFQTVIAGGAEAVLALPTAGQFAVTFAVHSLVSTDEYASSARQWLASHKHPRFQKLYTDLAYQPMLELIAYLRSNDFQVYSVTGSEIDFVRVVNEQSFGVPRDHVIGTILKTKFDAASKPAGLITLPDPLLIDDGDGKPIAIHNAIGRRPVAAFGNSDGDVPMLQWTSSGPGARLAMLVHHDDAAREFAYDRTSAVGKLDKGLDAARAGNWQVISMKSDWKQIFR